MQLGFASGMAIALLRELRCLSQHVRAVQLMDQAQQALGGDGKNKKNEGGVRCHCWLPFVVL